jgi:hypothetical protein
MRPFGAWFGRLAMAGTCLLGSGCGSGDIPDPDSDSHAASPDAQRGSLRKRGEEAPLEEPPKADNTALASNTPTPEPERSAPSGPTAKPDTGAKRDERPADSDKAPPSLKGDASGTDEMLRMAGSQGSTPPTGGSSATNGSSTPGGPSQPGNNPAAPGSAPNASPAPNAGGSSPNAEAAPNAGGGGGGGTVQPGVAPGGSGGGDRRMRNSQPGSGGAGAPSGPGGSGGSGGPTGPEGGPPPGAPGGPGGSGFGGAPGPGGGPGSGADTKGTAAFKNPGTAVRAFLAAVKAKDKERLKETVALHAPTEAVEKHRKIFAAIVEESISDDELDELSKSLEGYTVMSLLQPESSRRVGVVISKMSGLDRFQRTIMTRQEKAGWKVLDVDKALEFKFIATPTRRRR